MTMLVAGAGLVGAAVALVADRLLPPGLALGALATLVGWLLGSAPAAAILALTGLMPVILDRLLTARARRKVRRDSLRFLHAVLDAAQLGGHPLPILELAVHSCPAPARESLEAALRSARRDASLPVQLGEWARRWRDPTLTQFAVLVRSAIAQGVPLQRGISHLVEMEEARRQARAEQETALRALEWLTYGFLGLEIAGVLASAGSSATSMVRLAATPVGRIVALFIILTSMIAAAMPSFVRWSAP